MELLASKRKVLGKKVRFLRRQGITPVHLFGPNVEPMPLQCDTAQLQHVLVRTGKTGLISLKLDKEKTPRTVMVREVQREPRTDELLHVDFYQVDMKKEIKVEVPIVLVGEAPALRLKENFLTQELNSLTIECLPDRIPSRIELDVSSLTETGQAIHVKDIRLADGVTVLNNPEQLVAKVSIRYVEREVPVGKVEAEVKAEAPEEAAQPEKATEERLGQ